MRNWSFARYASIALGVGLLAGCSAGAGGVGSAGSSLPAAGAARAHGHFAPATLIPAWLRPAGVGRLHLNTHYKMSPDGGKGLIYASQFYDSYGTVRGYSNPNSSNNPPSCTLTGQYYVNGFGTDAKGRLILPAPVSGSVSNAITVFNKNCGSIVWQTTDPNGQPAAAADMKSASGTVLIGELANYTTGAGAIELCSSSGCGTPFSNSAITGYVAGVAMAKNGDCWASAEKASFSGFVLVYWAGCTGAGQVATGTSNSYYGGLFIDTHGNLGSVDLSGKLYIYSGCNPACTLVSSTTLQGSSLFGGLDKKGKHFVVGNYGSGSADVYSYSPSGVTYQYSITNGLSASDDVESAQFAPSNKKL